MADGRDYRQVLLVDRACTGGFEFFYDGEPWVFPAGELELSVSADVARFVFTHEHLKVHTVEGEYVHRVAIKAAPGFPKMVAMLTQELGPEVADDSAIEIDRTKIEGWDTRGVPRGEGITRIEPVNIDPSAFRGDKFRVGRAVGVER